MWEVTLEGLLEQTKQDSMEYYISIFLKFPIVLLILNSQFQPDKLVSFTYKGIIRNGQYKIIYDHKEAGDVDIPCERECFCFFYSQYSQNQPEDINLIKD